MGAIKVLKGQKVADYVFEAVHMIVTGKPYQLQFKAKKDAAVAETARKPVTVEPEQPAEAPVVLDAVVIEEKAETPAA